MYKRQPLLILLKEQKFLSLPECSIFSSFYGGGSGENLKNGGVHLMNDGVNDDILRRFLLQFQILIFGG